MAEPESPTGELVLVFDHVSSNLGSEHLFYRKGMSWLLQVRTVNICGPSR